LNLVLASRLLVVVAIATGFVIVPACGGDEDAPNNGVNDVRAACQIRAGWAKLDTEACTTCLAAAPLPTCECEAFRDVAGLCKAQGDARRAEKTCDSATEDCVAKCDKRNCECIEGCYARSEACKRVTAARDGCVADACAKHCN